MLVLSLIACDGTDTVPTTSDADLDPAFAEFSSNVTIYASDGDVVIETNGLPDHTSPYWSTGHSLYVAPTVTSEAQMAPGTIDEFNGSYELVVSATPTTTTPSSTGLGAIGIAVSGAVIYNDEEGPNVPLDNAVVSLDYNGAHTGPQSYHYHLEPKAWSDDDDALIGIIADGFFLYGRRETSTGGYPTDLDASNGHVGITPHHDEPIYHYHIDQDAYLGEYYILFPGDYQGTPSGIR